ncbi:MAG: RagB/SusD family nutrient uptake outer membrane protein [Bacteroidetes bacterium]|nr:MAG: RagB/SusD family nutrient uptake outer membrane protein [Bacteroidota bacterium]
MKLTKILTSLLVIMLLSSCVDDILDKKKPAELSSDTFFQTEDHAVWATNAIYNQLRDWDVHVFGFIGLTDIISDDSDKGSLPNDANFLNDVDNLTFDASNIAFLGVWTGYYRLIYRANLVIENVPNIQMDGDLQERLIHEARFLRGYAYFKLVRWFGDIPLIDHPLSPDEYTQERVAANEIYDFIIADLVAAAENLPEKSQYSSSDLGRVTAGAAKGLLAKVYLTMGDYPKAEQYAMAVIDSEEFELYPNYAELFREFAENSSESLFEVQAAAYEEGGGSTQYNQVQGVRGTPNLGWGFNRPSDNLVTSYEPGDPRREATILYVGEVLPDGSTVVQDNEALFNERYNQKAWVGSHPGFQENGPGNIRILRYADVLLMAAEALNENDKPEQALVYLNLVRERARGGNNFILPDVTVTDKDDLRQKIWRERRSELGMEQQRWFDIQRQQRAAEVMQGVGKDFVIGKHELLPIPQSEIDLSGGVLTQNPGY